MSLSCQFRVEKLAQKFFLVGYATVDLRTYHITGLKIITREYVVHYNMRTIQLLSDQNYQKTVVLEREKLACKMEFDKLGT